MLSLGCKLSLFAKVDEKGRSHHRMRFNIRVSMVVLGLFNQNVDTNKNQLCPLHTHSLALVLTESLNVSIVEISLVVSHNR